MKIAIVLGSVLPGRLLTGSITLARDLLRKVLVDELRLFVHPVVLGRGRRLFLEEWTSSHLRLIEEVGIHDVVLIRYGVSR